MEAITTIEHVIEVYKLVFGCKFTEKEFEEACLQLYFWQYGHRENEAPPSNFTAQIFTLFQKADPTNMWKMRKGFGAEFAAWHLWNNSPTQDEFFRKWVPRKEEEK